MSTFILPFDHRSAFARDIMGTNYPFSLADRQRAQELKRMIYDAFLEVREMYLGNDTLGILVDEETGAPLLHDAHHQGILTMLTLESSGEPALRLQYGEQSSQRIRMLGASLGKVLLRFDEFPSADDRQLRTLQSLHAQLTKAGQRLLIELLFTGREDEREDFLVHTMGVATEIGIVPEFWKVEALPTPQGWERVKRACHPSSGILLLGRGEDRAHVEHAVRIAAGVHGDGRRVVDGFAIGRTLFAEELRTFLAGTLKRKDAVSAIAHNFHSMITLWKSI